MGWAKFAIEKLLNGESAKGASSRTFDERQGQ